MDEDNDNQAQPAQLEAEVVRLLPVPPLLRLPDIHNLNPPRQPQGIPTLEDYLSAMRYTNDITALYAHHQYLDEPLVTGVHLADAVAYERDVLNGYKKPPVDMGPVTPSMQTLFDKLTAQLKAEFKASEDRISNDMTSMETRIKKDIAASKNQMKSKITSAETRIVDDLTKEMTTLKTEITERLNGLERRALATQVLSAKMYNAGLSTASGLSYMVVPNDNGDLPPTTLPALIDMTTISALTDIEARRYYTFYYPDQPAQGARNADRHQYRLRLIKTALGVPMVAH